MHYHLEIIIPPSPSDDIESIVRQVLEEFDENNPNARRVFWDWYVIGGRWDSVKLTRSFDQDKLDSFWSALNDMKITVSGVQCGIQELQPASQAGKVDRVFNDIFPEWGGKPCPFFKHGVNDQYKDAPDYPNVMRVDQLPEGFESAHVIIANCNNGEYSAETMFLTTLWNGVTFQDAAWNGSVMDAIDYHHERLKFYRQEYKDKVTVTGDWLAITVDYHS